jgi:hypothetical protein
MDPTALFSNICNFAEVGIHSLRFDGLPKSILVHVGRATGHDHSPQAFFPYSFSDNLLPWFRAHVDVIGAVGDVFDPTDFLGDRFDIDGPGNIDPTMADENTQFSHRPSFVIRDS